MKKRDKIMDFIENTTKEIGESLGIVDESMPQVGSLAYNKLKVNIMDEDCISMKNEPIDPLETIEDMSFDLDNMPDDK